MSRTEVAVKAYWDRKAIELGSDPRATMRDVILRSIEIDAVSSRLDRRDALLDVGCGNAFGSLIFAKHCRSVVAVDYSEEMVAAARRAIGASGRTNIRAEHADVLELAGLGSFTAVTCVRCLINLSGEELQYRALERIAQMLLSNGRLFLIEGIAENFAAINALRQQVGLSPIVLNWHNRLLSRRTLENWLSKFFTIEEVVDFGDYYFLSRVVHPMLVSPDEPNFESPMNRIAKIIWQNGTARGKFADLSTLLLHVCRIR